MKSDSAKESSEESSISLTIVRSPSDLTYSSHSSPTHIKMGTSPISSNLPNLLVNLRTNDGKDVGSQSGESTSKSSSTNILKSLGALNHSQEEFLRRHSSEEIIGRASPPINSDSTPTTKAEAFEFETDQAQTFKFPSVFLKDGLSLLKVSHKSKKRINLKIDPTNFTISWKNPLSIASSSFQRLLSTTSKSHSSSSPSKKSIEIHLDDIKSFIYQDNASPYREELHISKEFESNWATIVYFNHKKGKLKTLNLIADTEYDYKRLSIGLKNLRLYRDEITNQFLSISDDSIPKQLNLLHESNREVKELLTFQDILKYTKRLNINISIKYLKIVFDTVSGTALSSLKSSDVYDTHTFQSDQSSSTSSDNLVSGSKSTTSTGASTYLNFDQFKKFISILKVRTDINDIWDSICGKSNVMTLDNFKDFIVNIQKDNFDEEKLTRLFRKFGTVKNDFWLPENFNNFLLSKFSPCLVSLDENLDLPLNEYYISSSHNTYLIGRQVAGDSSINGYIRALQRGCKCVEIDIWDGKNDDVIEGASVTPNTGSNEEPVVNHGRTFTTAISIVNVLKTIKKYAFIASPLPLILSLEVHCSIQNQLKLINILKDILGDLLVLQPFKEHSTTLPSPSELKNRILLKVKKTGTTLNSAEGFVSTTSSTTTTSFSEDGNTSTRRNSFTLRSRSEKTKIIHELSDLGVYTQGIKFRNFSLPESKTFNHCFSLSEKSINSMLKDDVKRTSVNKHNRKFLMRIYPSKIRLTSSNFIPINYWAHGVQLVATNWQTYDLGQQINEAMFDVVNKSGYVLKPRQLRKPSLKTSKPLQTIVSDTKVRFRIQIISAHQLPKPKGADNPINPYITFDIIGASNVDWDEPIMAKGKTHTIVENGFNPIWNETFSGTISAPNDLVFVKFTVKSTSSLTDEAHSLGILVARLSYLKQGYRYLPIKDLLGEQLIYSSLFVKVEHSQI